MPEHPEPTTALGSGLGGIVATAAEQSAVDLICELTLLQVLRLCIEVLTRRAGASQNCLLTSSVVSWEQMHRNFIRTCPN